MLQQLQLLDTRLYFWIFNCYEQPHIAWLSRWTSRLGDGVAYLLAGLLLFWLEPVSGPDFLQAGLITFAIEVPLFLSLKQLIKRNRPCDYLSDITPAIQPADRFSFPSGHAAAAFAFASVLSIYYPGLSEAAFAVAGLIGLSRVLLGVHYPTDILAGALLGITSAMLGYNLYLM
ncbi:phosphatase PAP2 family protein [Aliamphritea spongicola]|uniref:phosphatase PAP2 family protein n=1 Tax=Aliamphritea spongicola TaxID=707589 RepID=UPI00196A30AE|nr:phosphatase PAP2 family protein [Aliamphritea spongicola]MBN3564798.1 phosphatase PAP2 family protein [Aliamphritea spongicola]